MVVTGGSRITRRKPDPVPLCPPESSHGIEPGPSAVGHRRIDSESGKARLKK